MYYGGDPPVRLEEGGRPAEPAGRGRVYTLRVRALSFSPVFRRAFPGELRNFSISKL